MADEFPLNPIPDRGFPQILHDAESPEAPALPAGFARHLAAQVQSTAPVADDFPIWMAGFAAGSLVLMAVLAILIQPGLDLRLIILTVPALNVVMGPIAAFALARINIRRISHAQHNA